MDGDAVADRPYDEAIELGDDDDDVSTPASSDAEDNSPKHVGAPTAESSPSKSQSSARGNAKKEAESSDDSSSESSGSSTDSEGDETGAQQTNSTSNNADNAYNPEEFKNMKTSPEIEELFQYISRYKPHTIELETSLKPFIPELIPCIGEVDAFLKIPPPDGKVGQLGLARLDEPCLNPSDPSILDLQLRTLSKHQNLEPMEVRSIEDAEKNPKEIENWIKRIEDLNRSKPAPNVQYSRKMPDIEQLMQVWPAEFEEFLQDNPLPGLADLELDLVSYIKLVASILDVPVYNQVTDTLHVIFTLFSEFKSNQHFSKVEAPRDGLAGEMYDFGPQQTFGPAAFGGPNSESIAPSRAPSPVQMSGGL
eukprot:gnl/MRDRNA2_/MRDRNA2_121311_c0_seq1.p1 gnl/MRDRNA2_/MRDRNA2_121311_c0~~gnl/MRDRNA2_/MRDRNA2_121311_c0_seq1.p1  ORF type:complete len:365 (-),score=81.99 gnl/MRDRNA2_/MRDRNA2_121311_c0_seq1:141-1235(-)